MLGEKGQQGISRQKLSIQ